MAKLTANVVVVGEQGDPVALLAGAEVPDWAADQIGEHVLDGPLEKSGEAEQEADPYKGMVKEQLLALVDQRNEGRPEEEQIKPESTKNPDLLAALKADDEATAKAEAEADES